MRCGQLIIEKREYVYLKRLLNISGYHDDFMVQQSLHRLNEELKTALVLDEREMPLDVVRFNSIVNIKANTGEERSIQVVMPADGNTVLNKISILKPMGAALMGYAVNDRVTWDFPGGRKTITIQSVTKDLHVKPIDMPI